MAKGLTEKRRGRSYTAARAQEEWKREIDLA